jgi:hypothetical protein
MSVAKQCRIKVGRRAFFSCAIIAWLVRRAALRGLLGASSSLPTEVRRVPMREPTCQIKHSINRLQKAH